MASVTLTTCWVHKASALSSYITLDVSATAEAADRPVTIKRYAAGRIRGVTQPGVAGVLTVTAPKTTRANADQLRLWVGEVVMFRDTLGRKMFGTFPSLLTTEAVGYTRPDVSFVLSEITWDEEV